MKLRLGLALCLLLGACATPTPEPATPSHPDPRFRADLSFTADGVRYQGLVLLPRKSSTKFVFDLPRETDMFLLNTCGREDIPIIYPSESQKTVEYLYLPAMDKENMGSCALLATAVTRRGEFFRAVIDFTNSTGRDLPVRLFCNGRWLDATGAGVCQTRAGIPIGVKVDVEALAEGPKECPGIRELSPRREWEFPAGAGLCGYDFMDREGRLFRLSVLGYTSVLNVFPAAGVKK